MTSVVYVPLMRGRDEVGYATIDAEDAVRVAAIRWNLSGDYAVSRTHGPMHRYILGLTPGIGFCHHKNEEKLDNRKSNLEVYATASEANRAPHPKRDDPVRQASYVAARLSSRVLGKPVAWFFGAEDVAA